MPLLSLINEGALKMGFAEDVETILADTPDDKQVKLPKENKKTGEGSGEAASPQTVG